MTGSVGETGPAPGRRRAATAAVVALALAGLGGGLFVLGSSLPSGSAVVSLPNRPVDGGAANPLDLGAHNSPTVVRNPVNPAELAIVNRVDLPQFSCALHVSDDAGATWADVPIPFPAGEEQPPRCFAPDAGFGPDGTLYLAFVTLAGRGNLPNAVWLVTSTDSGRTLSAPTKVAGPLAFHLRLLADPVRTGGLYLTWLQASAVGNLSFAGPVHVVLARSGDGGATWSRPVTVDDAAGAAGGRRLLAPAPAADRRGGLYVAYLDLLDDRLDYDGAHQGLGGEPYGGPWRLVVSRSQDGGATWTETVVDAALTPTERVVALFPPAPTLAVDGRHVYVAFADGRLGDADVWVWSSHDGGTRFAAPARVNDTPKGDRTDQYRPKLAVAPDGRLDVAYYDRRADPANVMTEVSIQSSADHGRTFSRRLPLSDRAFDSRIGFGADRALPDLGSRLGLASTKAGALAAWADTRAGTDVSLKQDVAVAATRLSSGSPARRPLQAAGLAVALLASAAGVATVGTARRRAR